MRIEYLYGITYLVSRESMSKKTDEFRTAELISAQIERERGIYIPPGELISERLYRADGSVVMLVRQKRRRSEESFFALDLYGNAEVGALCRALAAADELSEDTRFLLGEGEAWRVIFRSPSEQAELICRDFGDWCEVSETFAAKSAERLIEAARGQEIVLLGAAL